MCHSMRNVHTNEEVCSWQSILTVNSMSSWHCVEVASITTRLFGRLQGHAFRRYNHFQNLFVFF